MKPLFKGIDNDTIIHCRTKKVAKRVIKFIKEVVSVTDEKGSHNFNTYKYNTCYRIAEKEGSLYLVDLIEAAKRIECKLILGEEFLFRNTLNESRWYQGLPPQLQWRAKSEFMESMKEKKSKKKEAMQPPVIVDHIGLIKMSNDFVKEEMDYLHNQLLTLYKVPKDLFEKGPTGPSGSIGDPGKRILTPEAVEEFKTAWAKEMRKGGHHFIGSCDPAQSGKDVSRFVIFKDGKFHPSDTPEDDTTRALKHRGCFIISKELTEEIVLQRIQKALGREPKNAEQIKKSHLSDAFRETLKQAIQKCEEAENKTFSQKFAEALEKSPFAFLPKEKPHAYGSSAVSDVFNALQLSFNEKLYDISAIKAHRIVLHHKAKPERTELPEQWFVRVTPENKDKCVKWWKENCKEAVKWDYFFNLIRYANTLLLSTHQFDSSMFTTADHLKQNSYYKDYVEITIEELEKLTAKKQTLKEVAFFKITRENFGRLYEKAKKDTQLHVRMINIMLESDPFSRVMYLSPSFQIDVEKYLGADIATALDFGTQEANSKD